VYLLNAAGTQVIAASKDDNVNGDAVELLSYTNPSTTNAVDVNLMIVRHAGPDPGFVKYVQAGGSDITIAEHDTASGTVWGHPNASGAEAVGAAFYADTPVFGMSPPRLEPYSSAGPTRILFDTAGNRLAAPVIRAKPEIIALDGGSTTLPFPFSHFFGTSAAAPHAAGVAALLLQQQPGLSPDALYSALESTAVDMGAPGFDFDTGFGLVQAAAALQAVSTPAITLGLTLDRHTVAAGDAVQVNLSAANTGTSGLRDVYFLILVPPELSTSLGCPAGDAVLFGANLFASFVVRCAGTAPPQTFPALASSLPFPAIGSPPAIPPAFSLVWPAGLPSGVYTWVILITPPGAFADGSIDPGDIAAYALYSLHTSP
jgi:hypothetical protein